jgi:hypothetical protein
LIAKSLLFNLILKSSKLIHSLMSNFKRRQIGSNSMAFFMCQFKLAPLQQESEHWAQELECQLDNTPNTVESSSAETEMAVEGNESTEVEENREEEGKTPTLEPISTVTIESTTMEEESPSPWNAISMFNGAESFCQNQANKEGEEEELATPILAKVQSKIFSYFINLC